MAVITLYSCTSNAAEKSDYCSTPMAERDPFHFSPLHHYNLLLFHLFVHQWFNPRKNFLPKIQLLWFSFPFWFFHRFPILTWRPPFSHFWHLRLFFGFLVLVFGYGYSRCRFQMVNLFLHRFIGIQIYPLFMGFSLPQYFGIFQVRWLLLVYACN